MISVVVPIFNEEELISLFHVAVASAMNSVGEDWEVVYVNDGSRDSSLDLLKALQSEDPHIVVVDLSRNWGHMGAISAGMQTARGDAIVLMDGDFQDPPEVIPRLVNAWRAGAQVVVAVRRSRQERRMILAKLFPLFYRVLGALSDFPIPLNAGIFGLMDRQAVDSINSMQERNRYLPGLRAWAGYRNAVIYYDRQDRAAGDGKLSFISRIKYAMDAITSFSYKPLRLCFVLSLFSICIAAVLAFFAVFARSPMNSVGLSVAASVFLVGCLLLLCLGVLGEYLGRVYDEVRSRPLSIINKVYYAQAIAAQLDSEYPQEAADKIFRVA
ncbi:glycosyltransferase family 2 protein [Alloacidobacterium dinghuense]|uniref:Glycosyltransferase family 2 protein n=1 Tax=Alloacidobacterium dinghuense TaxID=2763107 RepID=A0A7G8BKX7_9BACT|nr:glycosyltransferase family 2 protein [Alloacidobacterium dinghuense]QNI33197.1 glycosyltransferase family 2 protein [Alloacidobacterium dinghuense]